jgi:hypothetical protein
VGGVGPLSGGIGQVSSQIPLAGPAARRPRQNPGPSDARSRRSRRERRLGALQCSLTDAPPPLADLGDAGFPCITLLEEICRSHQGPELTEFEPYGCTAKLLDFKLSCQLKACKIISNRFGAFAVHPIPTRFNYPIQVVCNFTMAPSAEAAGCTFCGVRAGTTLSAQISGDGSGNIECGCSR